MELMALSTPSSGSTPRPSFIYPSPMALPTNLNFEYAPLAPGEIRVLELQPGYHWEDIAGQLRHVLLENFRDYEAVSYTWGTESSTAQIFIDRKRMRVTLDLEAALKQFRGLPAERPSESELQDSEDLGGEQVRNIPPPSLRRLWVDAICINQEDMSERSRQINLMGRIYSNSRRLLVWLGCYQDDSCVAMDFITNLGRKKEEEVEEFHSWLVKEQDNLPHFQGIFNSLTRLIARPWFRRTWILQEYVLGAKDNMIFNCMEKQVSGNHLRASATVILDQIPKHIVYRFQDRVIMNQFHNAQRRVNVLAGAEEYVRASMSRKQLPLTPPSGKHSLIQWLEINRDSIAKDPRDKVYGVLGIIEHLYDDLDVLAYDLEPLIVDYSAKVEDVYSSVVKATVVATGRLDILGSCSKATPFVHRTWTPDWTASGQKNFITGSPRAPDFRPTRFTASADSNCVGTFSTDLNTLTVTGLAWDIVKSCTTCIKSAIPNERVSNELKRACVRINQSLKAKSVYGSERDTKLVLWRTLISTPANSRKISAPEEENDSLPPEYPGITLQELEDIPMEIGDWLQTLSGSCWSNKTLFSSLVDVPAHERSIVITEKGYVGQTVYPRRVKAGDVVCVLLGCSVPMVLRPVANHFEVIGDIYLHGIMYGEAMKALEEGKVQLQDFELH